MVQLDVGTLTGDLVVLEPLHTGHIAAIADAAADDRSTYALTHVPDGPGGARAYVEALLDDAARHRAAPFVQVRRADGRVLGCTRFMNPLWWLGRPYPDEIEVGGTWLHPAAQRTGINTEAKLLLLRHAFEVWEVQRVAICTDARNLRSRAAIERIGGTLEGVLRRHRPTAAADDVRPLRDTASYSIIVDEWPAVQARLRSLLDR